jgi:hypothetical protein
MVDSITETQQGLPGPTGTNTSSAAAYCIRPFIRGNGTFLARYTVQCAYSYRNLSAMRVISRGAYGECLRDCDTDARCYAFSFLLESDGGENCYLYNYFPLPNGEPNVLFNSGAYIVGSNNGMKR